MNEHNNTNGWQEWKNHVLAELHRQDQQQQAIMEKLDGIKTDVTVLKTKSMIYGGLAAVIVSIASKAIFG